MFSGGAEPDAEAAAGAAATGIDIIVGAATVPALSDVPKHIVTAITGLAWTFDRAGRAAPFPRPPQPFRVRWNTFWVAAVHAALLGDRCQKSRGIRRKCYACG